MKKYFKNIKLLEDNYVYSKSMEHDACGVGLVASTEGKKSRKVVEYGIEALKAVWHRGAVDADGKTGDGAGIHIEIPSEFFKEKIEITGHKYDNSEICVGMIFLPRNNYDAQENCRILIESELTKNNFSQNVLKEFSIGILNGVIFAIISAIIVQVWFNDTTLSLIISISMVLNMIVAGLFGILVPITLKKFNIDPAVASSVFVTTITDVIGFLSFLGIGAYFFYG